MYVEHNKNTASRCARCHASLQKALAVMQPQKFKGACHAVTRK